MPAKHLFIIKKPKKRLQKLPSSIQVRCIKALGRIQKNPVFGITLHGELFNYRKFCLGDYRVVYRFDKEKSTAFIVAIEHRQGVYK